MTEPERLGTHAAGSPNSHNSGQWAPCQQGSGPWLPRALPLLHTDRGGLVSTGRSWGGVPSPPLLTSIQPRLLCASGVRAGVSGGAHGEAPDSSAS